MVTLVISGVWLIKRWGYRAALRAGLAISVAVFGGIVAAGWAGSVSLFMALVFALGLGAGLALAGELHIERSAMRDEARAQTRATDEIAAPGF